jgi:hypothetical protein
MVNQNGQMLVKEAIFDLGSNHGKMDQKVHPPKSKFLIWHFSNINIRK